MLAVKDASTPKTNVPFWIRKFAENVERDRRTQTELEHLGWRVLVVWECELTKHTVETIRKVAGWLFGGGGRDRWPSFGPDLVDRDALLAVAEQRIRYRIASYDESPRANDSGTNEAQGPCKRDGLR